jgi:glutamine---fructose-6-phosphate transaminase (isomerizing)
VGSVQEVLITPALDLADGVLGIAHIRSATQGDVCQENAHPHLSCDKAFAVVHNGTISNFERIREELQAKRNHLFFSDTDSEVIVHLLEELVRDSGSVEEAFVRVLRFLEGTFAIAMISTYEPNRIFLRSAN